MSTKLDAEGLAAKRWPIEGDGIIESYAAAIREVAQPIADELAQVKAERDELRGALEDLLRGVSGGHDNAPCHAGLTTRENCYQCRRVDKARQLLAKYPAP